jgi:hypothetical protein
MVERLFVFRPDGTAFQGGKEVTVQATVYAELNENTGGTRHSGAPGAADVEGKPG